MSAKLEKLCQKLKEILGERIADPVLRLGEVTIECQADVYIEVACTLRDHPDLRFEELIDLSGIDYSAYAGWPGKRFAVACHLLSITHNWRLRLRAYAADAESPVLPSVTPVWNGANWYEREAFDMFGIVFEGHPDLRRILTDYGFVGHPFRKDFPVSGYVEMRYDPEQGRVVYQPVTIEPREVTPRVVREEKYGRG
ncbi:MAG: NADH-quinone oxidoreductase subunit C [Rhodocyclales bacterium]|nr:NADH-quinone oxidoreductase subunit C [Rhodocyclales bacterium]